MTKDKKLLSEKEYELNPLSWGMLFFAFWLSLIISPVEMSISQIIIAWFCFGLSIILWISIFIPWLRAQYKKTAVKKTIIPIVFEITIASFVIGFISSVSEMNEIIRNIVIYFGFIWVVTYLLILIRASNKGIGIIVSLVFIVNGAYLISNAKNTPDLIAGIVSILIGITSVFIAIRRPKWLWHESIL